MVGDSVSLKLYGPDARGNYSCWDPLNKKTVKLGTDLQTAKNLQSEILSKAGRGTSGARSSAPVVLPGEGLRKPVIPSFEPTTKPAETPPPRVGPKAADLLDSWIAQAGPVNDVAKPPPVAPPSDPSPSPSSLVPSPAPAKRPMPKGGISPEQAAKIGAGLKRIVTKANVVLDGAFVSMFGRNPAEPEDDELEMLAMGWEMLIEQWFVKNTPQPWMLVAAGNVLLIAGMYLQGEPKPKKTKAEKEAEANAQRLGAEVKQ